MFEGVQRGYQGPAGIGPWLQAMQPPSHAASRLGQAEALAAFPQRDVEALGEAREAIVARQAQLVEAAKHSKQNS